MHDMSLSKECRECYCIMDIEEGISCGGSKNREWCFCPMKRQLCGAAVLAPVNTPLPRPQMRPGPAHVAQLVGCHAVVVLPAASASLPPTTIIGSLANCMFCWVSVPQQHSVEKRPLKSGWCACCSADSWVWCSDEKEDFPPASEGVSALTRAGSGASRARSALCSCPFIEKKEKKRLRLSASI